MDDAVRSWSRAARIVLVICASLLAASALSGMASPVHGLFRFIPNDFNEGWNAYWADVAWSGASLYPPADTPLANNYPPLSFYVVGALGHLCGNNVFAGRAVAVASLLSIAFSLAIWLLAVGFARRTAFFVAALFGAAFVAFAPDYVAMDDPQLLGHALVIAGVTVLWRYDFSTRALAVAAGLMLLGGLAKPILLPVPCALTLWMAIERRECLLRWLAISSVLLGALAALLAWRYGTDFFRGLLSARVYSNLLAWRSMRRVAQRAPLLLLIGVACAWTAIAVERSRPTRQFAAFVLVYVLVAGGFGTFVARGMGVDRNAYFDLLIALSLAVGAGVEALRWRLERGEPRGFAAIALAGVVVSLTLEYTLHAAAVWPSSLREMRSTEDREAAYRAQIGWLRRAPPGVACEMLSLCYWAGRPFAVDFFNYGQKLETGAVRTATCERVFGVGRLASLQLDDPRGAVLSSRLPPDCNDVIRHAFVEVQTTPYGTLMRRR